MGSIDKILKIPGARKLSIKEQKQQNYLGGGGCFDGCWNFGWYGCAQHSSANEDEFNACLMEITASCTFYCK